MHPNVLYNGKIFPADEAILRAGQVGLLSGWGVFTTLRVSQGVPFAFERHWARLERDAALIHVELPLGRDETLADLERLIEANDAREATLRLCVVRARGGMWEGPGSGRSSDVVALSTDLTGWAETVALSVQEHGRHAASPFAGTKTLSWAHNLTMAEAAQRQGFGEVVLLNERGTVAECTSANIFAAFGGETRTPPLSDGPLPGVTRAVMLEELRVPDSPVVERSLTLDELFSADEVFITSSTRDLIPVDRIGDRVVRAAEARAWPVMNRLRDALRAYMRGYVEEQRAARQGR